MTNTEAAAVSAELIAEHLRFQLSNVNAELSLDDGNVLDVAFDADRDDTTVNFSVTTWDGSRERGPFLFSFTVVES